jgi:hypothetical protein
MSINLRNVSMSMPLLLLLLSVIAGEAFLADMGKIHLPILPVAISLISLAM